MGRPVSPRPRYNKWFTTRTTVFFLFPFSFMWYLDISTTLPRYGTDRYDAQEERSRNSTSSTLARESERHDEPSRVDVSERLKAVLETHPECTGKERVVEILLKAGKSEILKEECEILPTWDEVSRLYGEEPVIHGIETCQHYRDTLARAGLNGTAVDPEPRVAGLFDTGTNAFADSLHLNFRRVKSLTRTEYNLRGGKHTNLRYRNWARRIDNHGFDYLTKTFFTELPVVLIRDPFRWMGSMCKSPYNATWRRGAFERCPSLTPSAYELRYLTHINETIHPFEVRLNRTDYIERYDSLVDMWSDWYGRFFNATFPRLIIRFEDTLFHAEKVFGTVMECIGRPISQPYKYELEASKVHGSSSNFVNALAKYGTEKGRYAGLLPEDRLHVQTALDSTLMKAFRYPNAPLTMQPDYNIEEEQVSGLEKYAECKGKKRLLGALLRIGIKNLSEQSCDQLPTWNEITSTYGKEPIAIGAETCLMYRRTFGVGSIWNIRIEGMSTHLQLSFVRWLSENLHDAELWKSVNHSLGLDDEFESERYWEAHNRTSSIAPSFPIVLTMDPFRFMSDKCDNPEGLTWRRGWHGRCPNLVPSEIERSIVNTTFSSIDTFAVATRHRKFDSLADLWVSWSQKAVNSSYPRLLLRIEDALFHPERVLDAVSQCLGVKKKKSYKGSLLDRRALLAYGSERLRGLTSEDRLYAQNVLPNWLMQALNYRVVKAEGSISAYDEQFSGLEGKTSVCAGRKKLLGIIARSGKKNVAPKDCDALPLWGSFTELYGSEPVVLGLERCEQYRDLEARSGGSKTEVLIESLPHSGAAALAEALRLNVVNISVVSDISGEEQHFARRKIERGSSALPFLPLIVVRDPFRWMQLMCQEPYNANWTRGTQDRCPNFVPSADEQRDARYSNVTTFHVEMTYSDERGARYDSLADLWSSYYRSHIDADFPRLVLRFEDLLFHAEEVMKVVGDCMGRPMMKPYEYSLSDWRSLVGGRLASILKMYASEEGRYTHLTKEDLAYQKFALSPALMDAFHYKRMPNRGVDGEFPRHGVRQG